MIDWKPVWSELEISKQFKAADTIEILAEDNAKLIDVLESILETGVPRNRERAEKILALVKSEDRDEE